MAEGITELYLKSGEDRRLRAGHPWIFSNEVDTRRSPLQALEPGAPVRVRAAGGRPLGTGYGNPHSLICVRLLSRDPSMALDESLLVHRLNVALSLRARLYATPCYRLVHGEADGLPGLVVDRFAAVCVVQINTAGMERLRDALLNALERVVRPEHVLLRCDSPMRALEGLDSSVAWARGEGPATLTVEEDGAWFTVPAVTGQKTGWYYDQAANRARLARYAAGARVLDLYCYAGAWGVQAARAGAVAVLAVDSSREALAQAAGNAVANGVAGRFEARCGDALEVLEQLRAAGERFDVVVVDPPAFIKRRKDQRQGQGMYRRLNQAAMQVLAKDGLLVSASCSAHLAETDLQRIVLAAGRHLDRSLQVLEYGGQGPDHPVHPAIPETRYIKALFARVLPSD